MLVFFICGWIIWFDGWISNAFDGGKGSRDCNETSVGQANNIVIITIVTPTATTFTMRAVSTAAIAITCDDLFCGS